MTVTTQEDDPLVVLADELAEVYEEHDPDWVADAMSFAFRMQKDADRCRYGWVACTGRRMAEMGVDPPDFMICQHR